MDLESLQYTLDYFQHPENWKESISEKTPSWYKSPLGDEEFHIGLVSAEQDKEWANILSSLLEEKEFKVAKDGDYIHQSRVLVIVYSDATEYDENAVRHLTRAAERFNNGETIIIPVVHPSSTTRPLEQVPNNLAYSLSNTFFINFKEDLDPIDEAFGSLVETINSYVNGKKDYNISGVWSFKTVTTGYCGSSNWNVADWTCKITQNGETLTGVTVAGFDVYGTINENEVILRWRYDGNWFQMNEGWNITDYKMVGEIRGKLVNQGKRLEGVYVDVNETGVRHGRVAGTLEQQGITGYWRTTYGDPNKKNFFCSIHRGGRLVNFEMEGVWGIQMTGFWYSEVQKFLCNAWYGHYSGIGILGSVNRAPNTNDPFLTGATCRTHMKKVVYNRCPFKATWLPNFDSETPQILESSLDLSQLQNGGLRDLVLPRISQNPLKEGEYATLIIYPDHLNEAAVKLKEDLEESGIQPISLNIEDAYQTRSAIVLLTSKIKLKSDQIETISYWAETKISIFNIGMEGWFDIFGPTSWPDSDPLKIKLSNALARLNQTGPSTLDPTNKDYLALVARLKSLYEPLKYNINGVWAIRKGKTPSILVITVYSNSVTAYAFLRGESYMCLKGNIDNGRIQISNEWMNMDLNLDQKSSVLFGSSTLQRQGQEPVSEDVILSYEQKGISGCLKEQTDSKEVMAIVQSGHTNVLALWGKETYRGSITDNKILLTALDGSLLFLKYQKTPSYSFLSGFTEEDPERNRPLIFRKFVYFIGGGIPRVPDSGKSLECPSPNLGENLITLLNSLFDRNHEICSSFIQPGLIRNETVEAFNVACKPFGRALSVNRYIGNIPTSYGIRHEFDIDFEKKKAERFHVQLSSNGLIRDFHSIHEEAQNQGGNIYDAMISYRSRDSGFIDLLQSYLESNGILCWRDRRMEVGTNWSEDITKAVRRSSFIIACLSQDYVTSPLCTKEVRMAFEAGKFIIPIILPVTDREAPRKLVGNPYTDDSLPFTIARELGNVTPVDFRALSGGADPTNKEEFETKYSEVLENLLNQSNNIKQGSTLYNLTGTWDCVCENKNLSTKGEKLEFTLGIIHRPGSTEGYCFCPSHYREFLVNGDTLTQSLYELALGAGDWDMYCTVKISTDGLSFTGTFGKTNGDRGTITGSRYYTPSSVALYGRAPHPDMLTLLDRFWITLMTGCHYSFYNLWTPEYHSYITLEYFDYKKTEALSFGSYICCEFTDEKYPQNGMEVYVFNVVFSHSTKKWCFAFQNGTVIYSEPYPETNTETQPVENPEDTNLDFDGV